MRRKTVVGILVVSLTLFLAGCYTQFVTTTKPAVPETIKTVVDSTGDTIRVINRTDTVLEQDRETCVWERDLMGYPQLHCYQSNYPRNWFQYSNTPWWYRTDPSWRDFDRCPRYYFYDLDCGCCRYSGQNYDYSRYGGYYGNYDHHDYDHHGSSGDGGRGGNGGSSSSGSSGNPSVKASSRTTAKPVTASSQPAQEPAGSPKIIEDQRETVQEPQQNEPMHDTPDVRQRVIRSPRSR
jgi:hypothetical protein